MIKVLSFPYVKKCWRCGETKSKECFNSDRSQPIDWLSRRCKDCHQEMKRQGRKRKGYIPRRLLTPEELASRRRTYSAKKRRNLRLQVIEEYGGKCQCLGCDEDHIEFLSVDHVNGDGAAHRREIGSKLYVWLRKNGFPKENFRLLCHNCNSSRGSYGYCPHEFTGTQFF